jgi:glycosyltransferase involved in cell wall biosynthesis
VQKPLEFGGASPRSVTVIVPAYNAASTLPACLAAIAAMTYPATEVIVFSDGATDLTDSIACNAGVRVVRNDGPPRGPAFARNSAAVLASCELLLFVDSDVVIAPEALALLVQDLTLNRAQAAFGSYDSQPESQGAASQYANLRHHFVHQHSARDASSFWSGLGLIDRRIFLQAKGFDARRFAHPSIEDVELGFRLIEQGYRIRLVPEAQGKHCKDWSLWRVWHTDIVRRAWPWACLLADGRTAGVDLNLARSERVKAMPALAIAGTLAIGAGHIASLAFACAMLAVYLWLNRAFFALLARRLSPLGLLYAVWMHGCYHLYAVATYLAAMLWTRFGLRRRAI